MDDVWYLTRDGKRFGPYPFAQLRELADSGQLAPDDLVWQQGGTNWLAASQVPGLITSSGSWYYLDNGQRRGPITDDELKRRVGNGTLRLDDLVWREGMAEWAPLRNFVEVHDDILAPGAFIGSLFGKAFRKLKSLGDKSSPPAVETPAPAIAAEDKGIVFADTGLMVADHLARCREQFRVEKAALLFLGPTNTRRASGLVGTVRDIVSGTETVQPIMHLAVTEREIDLVWVDDGKVIVDRNLLERSAWVFSPIESGGLASLFGLGRKVAEELTLTLPSGETTVELKCGPGLDRLQQVLSYFALARAEAYLARGWLHLADRALTMTVEGRRDPVRFEAIRAKVGTIAWVTANYEGGHPQMPNRARGALRLDALGLEFVPLSDLKRSVRIGRESLVRFEAPQPGSFSEEQVRAAEAKRLAAKAVGKLAEMGSKANRDDPEYQGALHLAGAGARGAEWLAELGPLPINRIDIVVRIADREQVLRFDVMAATKKEMEAEAKQFWSRATNAGR